MAFKGNPILFYDNGVWGKLGYAVPNFGPREQTCNSAIGGFVESVGRNLQALMHHEDARSAAPPSMDTVLDINRLTLRARDLLAAEMLREGRTKEPSVHDVPAKEPFMVFPTPFFFVRNKWMKKYCRYVLSALAEAMQSSENDQCELISEAATKVIARPLVKLYKSFCIELLHISEDDPQFPKIQIAMDITQNPPVPLMEPDWKRFTLGNDQLRSYRPSQWFTPTELIDTVTPNDDIPTAYDLLPVTAGIPVPELPVLGPYPFGVKDSAVDSMADPSTLKPTAAPGSGQSADQLASAAVRPAVPGQTTSAFP